MLFGSIEAGGTKFVCGIGNEKGDILERLSLPTTTPEETLAGCEHFFEGKDVSAIGIGSFGPVDLDPSSATYGHIMNTPKLAWKHFDLFGAAKLRWNVPIGLDTDVNAAALAESKWGAAAGLQNCLYITVGTGIGAGAVVDGQMLKGISHPEMGHILVRRRHDDTYKGGCPYHTDCLEGLAAGPAIEARWGKKGVELQEDHKVWELEAFYLSEALVNYILTLAPKKIIMGGGVMKQRQLFPLIHHQVQQKLNDYVFFSQLTSEKIADYIVPPQLEDNAGIKGAMAIAQQAYDETS
ncbi:ROK family protein [Longirhabdus pacifica]|uniref:ROK family protein n=1 Tax=Longirhabdus pacifica TaxID=2305227 RepID=UPI001008D64A|nr:ROK family protein [Longirhabdus pacifica]